MPKVKVAAFSISLDGFAAGPRQDLQNPLGVRGTELHQWFFPTDTFKKMQGQNGGSTGIDNDMAAQSFDNVGAWILGRNMFGPIRRSLARRFLERLVGRRASVSHASFCADAPRPRSACDGGRHNFLLHHRWDRIRVKEGKRGGPGKRCTNRRRSLDHSPVSRRWSD